MIQIVEDCGGFTFFIAGKQIGFIEDDRNQKEHITELLTNLDRDFEFIGWNQFNRQWRGVTEDIHHEFKGDGENCVVCGRFILKNAAHRNAAIGWVHLECWE